jgi:hypothetical protein
MDTSARGFDTTYCAETSDWYAENTEPFAESSGDSAEQTEYFTEESDRSAKLSGDGAKLIDRIA